jgi:hypothetical protein
LIPLCHSGLVPSLHIVQTLCGSHTCHTPTLFYPSLSPFIICQVRWAGFSLKQRAWLNITNQRSAYAEQPLLLYTLASNSGVLPPGAQLQLPGLSSADGSGPQEAPCQLVFPPAVVLCNARGDTTKLTPAAASAVSTITAQTIHQNGRGDSMPGGLQLLAVDTDNLATCPLEDVCFALEEGMFDASNLGQAAADALLHRCAHGPHHAKMVGLYPIRVFARPCCSLLPVVPPQTATPPLTCFKCTGPWQQETTSCC